MNARIRTLIGLALFAGLFAPLSTAQGHPKDMPAGVRYIGFVGDDAYYEGKYLEPLAMGDNVPVAAAMNPNPELRSRAILWGELDGSFLVDPSNAAEVLDFSYTVMRGKEFNYGYTGSVTGGTAGAVSASFRQREYAQINAYRALAGTLPVVENPVRLPIMQEGALFLARPGAPFTHNIPTDAPGFNVYAGVAAQTSLLAGTWGGDPWYRFSQTHITDIFIEDGGSGNWEAQGHRGAILNPRFDRVTLGLADTGIVRASAFSVVNMDGNLTSSYAPFVTWPAPGYFPSNVLRYSASGVYRWYFTFNQNVIPVSAFNRPPNGATFSARVDGVPVALVNFYALGPVGQKTSFSWEFASAVLQMGSPYEGAFPTTTKRVDITVANLDPTLVPGGAYSYAVFVGPDDESVKFPVPTPITPMANLSTRGRIGQGEQVLIGGFTVSGTMPMKVLFRAQGPGLGRFGLTDTATGLNIELYEQSQSAAVALGSNSTWKDGPHWRLVQAYDLAPTDASEPVVAATLWPGAYTAVLSADRSGIGIIEAFNIDASSTSRLSNLSTRGVVGSGPDQLIAGITLTKPTRILVRTQGPSLSRFGVAAAVADTDLRIVRADGTVVASNTNWRDEPANTDLLDGGVAAGLAPSDAKEAALIVDLPAGSFTALVSTPGSPGVGIVEVFEL